MSQADLKKKKKWLKWLFRLAVLGILVWFVYGAIQQAVTDLQSEEARSFTWKMNPWWLTLAGVLYLVGTLPMAMFWYRTLRALGQEPRLGETLGAFYVGHLGKYAPGKAMVVVIRAGMLRSSRVNGAVAAASVFLETLTMMAVGAFLATGILAFLPHADQRPGYLVPLAIALMFAAGLPTWPPIFRFLVVRLGVAKSDPQVAEKVRGVNFRLMIWGWLTVTGGWLLLGLSLWATLEAMGIEGLEPFGHLHYYTAAVALAMVAGFLSLIPSGAGVREVILMAIMGVYFSQVIKIGQSEAAAIVSAVLLRLVWLVSELVISGIIYLCVRRRSPRQEPA